MAARPWARGTVVVEVDPAKSGSCHKYIRTYPAKLPSSSLGYCTFMQDLKLCYLSPLFVCMSLYHFSALHQLNPGVDSGLCATSRAKLGEFMVFSAIAMPETPDNSSKVHTTAAESVK